MTTTVNAFWGSDTMDSSVWTFKPRTCGVPGVSFPHKAGYINWDLLNHKENAGRKVSVSQEDINKFADQLRRKGILSDNCSTNFLL